MRVVLDVNAVMNDSERAVVTHEACFTEIFEACYDRVLAYARRRVGADLAQDVVAEAFLAAWRNLEELPPEPLPWLYRAAHFAIANQHRALARRGRLDERARLLADGYEVADHSDRVVADMELAAAFRSLSEADRELLRLAAWEGLTAAAIGAVIGCSSMAAKVRLHRARRRLSQRLSAGTPQPGLRSQAQATLRRKATNE